MGFGHAVYKTDDPRSLLLHRVAERLEGPRVAFARQIERQVVDILEELKPGRELYANVEYYAGVVMEAVGLPPEMFPRRSPPAARSAGARTSWSRPPTTA